MPRFDHTITLGNILTIVAFVFGALSLAYGNPGDLIRVQASVKALEAVNVTRAEADLQFRLSVLNRLDNLQTDIRELRTQGFRFSELPPSPHHRNK